MQIGPSYYDILPTSHSKWKVRLFSDVKTAFSDTYVKTYLTDGNKKTQKKKTSIIKCNFDPMYRQKIKYSACDVYRRQIQVKGPTMNTEKQVESSVKH